MRMLEVQSVLVVESGAAESCSITALHATLDVMNSRKLSSRGVLTGRVLLWIQFFFIQKQRMKRMNNYTTHSTVSNKFESRPAYIKITKAQLA